MKTFSTTTDLSKPLESSRKKEASPDAEKFRKYFELKTEETEEKREEKKPTVFDLAAEQKSQLVPPFSNFQLHSAADAACEAKLSSLSKAQCDCIVSQATYAISTVVQSGVKETSLRLDGPAFQNSPLHGMELIIKEFSTAPLAFNIEFRGSLEALRVLKPNLTDLKAAFHQPEGYAIHRIEASLEDTSPFLFHRKPAAEGGSSL